MASKNQEGGRTFTFVDYDINRRGVTDLARAHLMKDRVRSKREANSKSLSRNHFLPLRWMYPKEENGGQKPDFAHSTATATAAAAPDRQLGIQRPLISDYASVIDFPKDIVPLSALTSRSRSVSPSSSGRKQVDTSQNAATRQACPESGSISRHTSQPLEARGDRLGVSGSTESPSPSEPNSSLGTDNPEVCVDQALPGGTADTQPALRVTAEPTAKRGRVSLRNDSEFGLLFSQIANNTPPNPNPNPNLPPQPKILRKTVSAPGTPVPSILLPELETSCEGTSILSTPSDRNLIGYFAANAGAMLGFDRFPEIVQQYNPVLTLFVPFALSSQWCFETMVLLQSAYHHRRSVPSVDSRMLEGENQYLASRQNDILARTRSRISALAVDGDSTDEDVIAFLFLAVAEYRAGQRQIGLMHFQAWKEYCEMRRKLRVKPCGLPCKIVVWWCVSMLVGEDVILDSILDPSTTERVRKDPAKLFRYFVNRSPATATMAEGTEEPVPVPVKLSRHNTW
ncbi:hypothetical protein A1O3_01751 [Capronia epimyces CBS 606.96]|uniref:Uncharacterized protein n=1 Tax=Capronia epimyces CBS 606.96 TaxID=1182542 RepID=W9ZF99_9EURO|nr:uncharacterized protein A1O3_01751 [Capronia epimyces CBS 606.96]EXJ93194.1 hypothetical protein A1O3_01751 [Capronia epimyces CBS 606.96]